MKFRRNLGQRKERLKFQKKRRPRESEGGGGGGEEGGEGDRDKVIPRTAMRIYSGG